MKRKLLSLFLVLCMILPLNVTTLVYADSYESGGTYVSSIDYTCVNSSDNDLTVSAECYYTETRSGYPSTGQIVLNQNYDLNVPSNSNDVTVTLNLSEAGTGMTFELYDDPRYYDPDVGESTYLESDEYDFDSDTNIVTLSDWNGHYTSFGFYVSNDGSYDTLKEWVYITIYSGKTIEADDTCTVRVMNPLEGLSTDVPASGETEDIQFYGYAFGYVGDNQDITIDYDNITYSFARGDDKAMTGITLDSETGIMTIDDSVEPGLVKVTATYEITGTTGYEYLVISDTGKYGYTSYVSYSNENNSDDRGYMQDCLVTLTKADGTVYTATSLSDGFVWINNITDYDGDVTITGAKTGYLLYSTKNYTAYKCSTKSYVSMYIPEVLFSGGSGTSEDPYQISTVADLEELAARVNGADDYSANDFSGEYFTLTTDLDLNNEEWTPIGRAVVTEWDTIVKPFSGTFDGAEHTISKLSINSSSSYQGLFGYVDGGTIKNLSVTDSSISVSDAYNVGGIVGYITNNATIDNCSFSGNISGPLYVGGIAGYANNSVIITNCENSGSISETVGLYGSAATGGIVGRINASTVTSCDNRGTVNGAYDYVGGIVGQVYSNSTISNCTNTGTVNGVNYVGGIASYASNATILYCVNSGDVTGTADYAGGIVSYGDTPLTIQHCYNTGNVSGNNYSGGIIGYNNQGDVSSCYNTGDFESTSNYTGGIVAYNDAGIIEYCYNTGYFYAESYSGGIVGSNNSGTVQYCYNIGDLNGRFYWGYIVGETSGTVQYCYYDTQMAYYSGAIGSNGDGADDTANHVEGKTTANMLGDLFGDTTHWTTNSNLYPRLADPSGSTFDMDTTDVAYVSVVPIRFVDGETIVKVTKDFTVCTDNGVAWASEDSDLISITGSNATVLKGDSTTYEWGITVTASLNDASRKVYYVNPFSDDAGITSILSESITAGSEAGTSAEPLTASISVANSVSAVAATDIVGADCATVVFYGTDSTFTTAEAGSVALTAGDTTTVYIKVTAQDGVTVGYYAVDITRAAIVSSNSIFLITQSSPDDSSTATSYYYVYAGNSEASLLPFAGSSADGATNTAYSTVDKAIIDINASAASSALLHFAATGNTLENASGTLKTGDKTITLISGTYTIKGAVETIEGTSGNGLLKLEGASVIIEGATIESVDYGIRNNGDGSVTVNSGIITSSFYAIFSGDGNVTVNGGTIFGTTGGIYTNGAGNIVVNNGTITSDDVTILLASSSSGNLMVSGGSISSSGVSDGNAIDSDGSGDMTITGGKVYSLGEAAVYYNGSGNLIISGDLWNDTTQTGTLLSSGAKGINSNALLIGPFVISAEIKGGTLSSDGVTVYAKADTAISGGLIQATDDMPALFNENSTISITGGTITSNNMNISLDISDFNNIKFPGTVFSSSSDTTAKLYISGGTISNTAATGYAVGNYFIMSGYDSYIYLSGTPTSTGNTATVSSYNNIYANDGNGTYYTGSPVSVYYSESIVPGTTVAVSGVSATTNASLFSLVNEGYSLQLSGTDLIILQATSASTGLTGVAPTSSGGTDGSITGTTSKMEYKLLTAADSEYVACFEGSTTVGAAGDYSVRVAAEDTNLASAPVTVTVPENTNSEGSSNSSLSSILSQNITAGSEAGTVGDPKTASISVANNVSAVAASDIAGADNATVKFYGTDSTFTTAETGSVALTAGDTSTVYIKVTAQDGETVSYYAVEITRAAAVSSDTSLSTVLDKEITTEGMGGTVEFPLTTSISVANNVSAVSASDIAGADNAAIEFYGTDSTFTTAETGSVALTAGDKTTVYIKVTAQDGETVSYYAVEITRAAAVSSDTSLSTVLSKEISTECMGGTALVPINTSISVANSVYAVVASDIAGADNAAIEFYGTDSTFTTAETGSVALTAGDKTTVYIKVTAQDEVTVGYYAVEITRAAVVSSDSSLSTVLSKEISTEGMGGTALVPINTSISVANSVYAVEATDIVGADNAAVEFYGTDSMFAAAEIGSVLLAEGDTTTVYIKVTAQDEQTVGYYAVGITRAAAVSSDSSLSTVLSKDISTEGMGGTVEFPITTSISVVNSVSAVEAADIIGATDSTVIFYGTDSTFTTAETGSVALTAGDKTTVYIKVTAQDGQTVGYYAVTISRAAASSNSSGSSSSSSHPSSSSQSSSSSGTDVLVNGVAQSAGNEITETVDGKTKTTINVNEDVLSQKIAETIANNSIDGTEQNTVEVVVRDTNSDESTVQLNGAIINEMEDNYFDLKLNKGDVSYSIPAKEFTIDAVAEQMGVNEDDLADIEIEINISEPTEEVIETYEAAVATMGDEMIIPPVSFEIVAHTTNSDGTESTVEINTFSTYVERVFEIPEGVDPSKITTGIIFNQDGTYSHVPTEVFQKDGKWYAKLNSLTNSIYSVVWNPVTVKSVENHWSKDAVNDMASRLIIFNTENFSPDKAITRADFAEYIVRALGIYREGSKHENNFTDVSANGDRTLAILIANEYGIVAGYPDGSFRPDALITREEAMTMYQRAMKITKLVGIDNNRYQSYTDYKQVGSWATSYVQAVLSAHVFDGTTATTISPKSNLTYAEAAQAIKNLLVESRLINK